MILLQDLLAVGGQLAGPVRSAQFNDWCYDSRLMVPGACFIALRTPRADGHDFIPAALAAGATGILCRWPPADPGDATIIVADDPEALLQRWAAARLAAVKPKVIAVAGSVGKTSTRRAIAAVLEQLAPTFQSRRSFNSLLGLPIALARLEDQHRYAVLEFGSERPGELNQLVKLFPPEIVVLTRLGEVHLRGLGDLRGVTTEYGNLVRELAAGVDLVFNGDDPRVGGIGGDRSWRAMERAVGYGRGKRADVRASHVRYALDGTRFRLHHELFGEMEEAFVPLLGRPGLEAALAAAGVGIIYHIALDQIVKALATLEPPAGRLRPLTGLSGATILDDSLGASPPSVRAALETLAALPAARRIAVLGPLAGLPPGGEAPFYHELGTRAAQAADLVVCKGDWGVVMSRAAQAQRPDLPITIADTTAGLLTALPADLGKGDLVLVTGDAVARMERVVKALVVGEPAPGAAPMTTDESNPVEPVPTPAIVRQEATWHSVRIGMPDRPTWLQVDLDALAGNVAALRAATATPVMAVLKGDGYGHGAIRTARAALRGGAAALAVATLGEARLMREQAIQAPILLLGYLPPWQADEAVRLDLECTLFDHDLAEALAAAAQNQQRPARVQIKVDTGMARLGLRPDEVGPFLARLRDLSGLHVTGIYSHFARADEADLGPSEAQLAQFVNLLQSLTAAGMRPPLAHIANSAAALRLPASRLDIIRPGLACYGLSPAADLPLPVGMRPALSLHSEVAQVRAHPAGTPISYGATYHTPKPALIATIPAGYADGVRRSPAWQHILVRGQRAPIVGRICMDSLMADVSAIDGVRRGDPVVLIGSQGEARITAEEVATWLGTISYEVLTGILPRVPREVGE
ncbi:MAG: alanine racemase [Oscillochloridaceae bacterium umkhey_bin13]